MASLHVMNKKTRWKKEKSPVRNDKYMNEKATKYTIEYITRTRAHETRKDELVSYGSVNISFESPKEAIMKMEKVQNRFKRKTQRPYVRHEVVTINERDFYKMEENFSNVEAVACDIGEMYHQMGYQEIHAIHDARGKNTESPNKGIHIHFIINAYGYKGGRRFSEKSRDFMARRKEVVKKVENHYTRPVTCPIEFLDRNVSILQ